jgi:transcription elongation factor SPT6
LKVFELAVQFMQKEISHQPVIRTFFADKYQATACFSTYPTEKGNIEIDAINPNFRIKRIKNYPIQKVADDLWLEVSEAERKGLIRVEIGAGRMDKEVEEESSMHDLIIN